MGIFILYPFLSDLGRMIFEKLIVCRHIANDLCPNTCNATFISVMLFHGPDVIINSKLVSLTLKLILILFILYCKFVNKLFFVCKYFLFILGDKNNPFTSLEKIKRTQHNLRVIATLWYFNTRGHQFSRI